MGSVELTVTLNTWVCREWQGRRISIGMHVWEGERLDLARGGATHVRGRAGHSRGSEAARRRRAGGAEVACDRVVITTDEVELEHVTLSGRDRVGGECETALADVDLDGGGSGRCREGNGEKTLQHVFLVDETLRGEQIMQ